MSEDPEKYAPFKDKGEWQAFWIVVGVGFALIFGLILMFGLVMK